ncbi:MAG: rubrerythrin [Selenomonadaceae bacterium]|nr:rubrerythrin [Selenomonadaceae bacterium]
MSLHGQTKGTKFEQMSAMLAQGEANGTMMYYALARLAKEQGLDDVAADFIEAANQEAVHAGFYATLNGKVPQDFWPMVRGVMAAETSGETAVKGMADKFRAAGLTEAADEMEIFAKQEGHHGVVLKKILEKYKPELLKVEDKTIYVCACCGYEYIGDLDAEPETFVCPICGQPKKVFRLRA